MANDKKENLNDQEIHEQVEENVLDEAQELDGELNPADAEIQSLKAEKEQLYEQYIRAAAEAQNIKRRAEIDVANAHKYALDKFVKEGSQLMYKMFLGVCEKYGVKQISPEGEKLNPEFHQAISMIPHEGYETNQIITVAQNGYLLNDRLIRAAQVIVAK